MHEQPVFQSAARMIVAGLIAVNKPAIMVEELQKPA